MPGIEGRLRFLGFAGVLVVFSIAKGPGLFILPNFLTNFYFHRGRSKVFSYFRGETDESGLER